MNPVALVVGVSFILLTADFRLVLARLIARDRNAVPLNNSVSPPLGRTCSSE
jgi:hypothetical protein